MFTATIKGKTFDVLSVYRSSEALRGSYREVLMLNIPTNAISYDELYALVKDTDALKTIITTNRDKYDPEGAVSNATFENYIVPGEPVLFLSEEGNPHGGAVAKIEVFVVKLGKLTYVEEQLMKLGIGPLE